MYGRKKKEKKAKKMKACPNGECQHEVPKAVAENKKVKPKEVFGSKYKENNSSVNKKKK